MTDLVDIVFHNRYNSSKDRTGQSSSVDTFELLDDQLVLAAHDDFILRVFDLKSGKNVNNCFASRIGNRMMGINLETYFSSYTECCVN